MNVILQKDVKNLGKAGDQVSVKKGFARNFLIPKAYAIPIDKGRLKVWKHQQIIIAAKKRKAISERKKLLEQLSSIKLKFEKSAQKDNRLFGSVTAHEISQALEELHALSVDKRDIHFSELKTVGEHSVKIRLDSEHQTEIKLSIKAKISAKGDSQKAVPEEAVPEEAVPEKTPTDKKLQKEPVELKNSKPPQSDSSALKKMEGPAEISDEQTATPDEQTSAPDEQTSDEQTPDEQTPAPDEQTSDEKTSDEQTPAPDEQSFKSSPELSSEKPVKKSSEEEKKSAQKSNFLKKIFRKN